MGETTMRLGRVREPMVMGKNGWVGFWEAIQGIGCGRRGFVAEKQPGAGSDKKEASLGTKPLEERRNVEEGKTWLASVGNPSPGSSPGNVNPLQHPGK
jgi:hypothetical protein